jgi:PAS domain S-box-containing protein
MLFDIQLSPLLLPYAASAVLTIALSVYAVLHIQQQGWDKTIGSFLGIVVASSIWSVSRFFEFLFVNEAITNFWIAVLYIGFGGATMAGLFFGLVFTGRKHLVTKRTVPLILAFPVLAFGLAATNQYHELFWVATYEGSSGWWGDILVMNREFQPLFMLYLLYSVGGTLVGLAYLLRMAFTSPNIYRNQTIAFTVGAIVPVTLGVMFVTGTTFPYIPAFIDLTPVGFAFMGLFFGYGIFRHQMLDLVPVARDTVIESMRDGFVVVDADDRIVDFNNAAKEFMETGDESVGESITSCLPAAESALEEHDHGTRAEREIEVDLRDDQRFLELNISSLKQEGNLIGRLLLLRDITQQRAVQKRYQALIENSSDLTLVVDRDGTMTYVSPSMRNITGAEPEDMVGLNAFNFVHNEDEEPFRDAFDDLVAEPGSKIREEFRIMDEDGNWLVMEGSLRNLRDNPFVEGIVVNAREITERKERERELEAANRELERSNEQLDQFAGVISHDLRNPINVARGHLDLAQDGREESFEKIGDSLERMEAIINDVLALAREGQSIGETEEVELAERAEVAWDHVATDEADLKVAEDGTFKADPDRLLQLFENLFRNAHEHVGDDVEVTVGLSDGTMYVEDDGPGIPEERRDKVLESGHTTNQDGTGLGLSIVSQIAEAHGWDLQVAEGSTGGARFNVVGVRS